MAVLQSLKKAIERFVCHDNPREPLDRRHSVPSGHHQPDRKAVCWGQLRAVHLICDYNISASGFGDRQTSGKVDLTGRFWIVFYFSLIGPFKHYVNRIGLQSGSLLKTTG